MVFLLFLVVDLGSIRSLQATRLKARIATTYASSGEERGPIIFKRLLALFSLE
jgi:hypothetical protein